jgi:hypothetical protein
MFLRKRVGYKQNLTRVHPTPEHNGVREDDLFAGVTLDEPVSVA